MQKSNIANIEAEDAALPIHGLSGSPLEMQYLAKRLSAAAMPC